MGGGGSTAIPPGTPNRGVAGTLHSHQRGASAKATPLSYADLVDSDAPVAFYRLMETSGNAAHDSSGHGYDGAYHPTVAQGQTALLKSDRTAMSVAFPAGYVTEQATWTNEAVTAECWMRPTAGDLAALPRIIENAWTDHSGNGFMLWISSGTVAFNTGWLQTVAPSKLKAGKTYYVAGTYDNATGATLYLNGLEVANKMPGSNLPNPQQGDSNITYIGVLQTGDQFGLNDYFQGDLADCALYDHVLSAQQIVTHYDVGADAQATAAPPPTPTPSPSPPPSPTPNPSPLAYDATSACIDGKVYENNVLPGGEGEFATSGLDVNWWGRQRGNNIGGNQYSGFQTSWGRDQYDTWFTDPSDGLGLPFPIAYAQDTTAPGAPWGVQITAAQLPGSLAGSSAVGGAHWYSGVLDDPVDLTYGFFVARVRMPDPDPGMSPAFWLLTNNGVPQGSHGELAGEWDVQEMFGNDLGNGMNAGTRSLWNSGSSTPQNWGGTYDWHIIVGRCATVRRLSRFRRAHQNPWHENLARLLRSGRPRLRLRDRRHRHH